MDTPVYPPIDGSLSTPVDFLDFNAKHNAKASYLVFPSSRSPQSVASVSFEQMALATHKVAHMLRPGREGPEGEVIAVLVHTDVPLYIAILLGIFRTGWIPYPISPRNSVEAVSNMLQTTSCRRLIVHKWTSQLASGVQSDLALNGIDVELIDLPTLPSLFPHLSSLGGQQADVISPYPVSHVPVEMNSLATYLHSSGSTGLPKSVPIAFSQIMAWFKGPFFASYRDVKLGLAGLPTFHMMGVSWQVCSPLYSVSPIAVHAPQFPESPVVPHPQNVLEVAKLTECTGIITIPSFVEAWSHSPENVEFLKKLQIVLFAGGPVSAQIGDTLISQGVTLGTMYGGTEFPNPATPPPICNVDPNWSWLRFTSKTVESEWDSQDDGTYELIVYENEHHHLTAYTGTNPKVYATKDLFMPHPVEKDLWKIVARKDDVIALSIGEKIVPNTQEGRISASPFVSGVVMFGRAHEQPGVLIEPHPSHVIDPDNQDALSDFRNKIWPSVELANYGVPGFARIFKEMILVARPDKPLPRAGKGTVIRKQSLALYADEIEEIYRRVEESKDAGDILPPISWTDDHVRTWLVEHARLIVDGVDVMPAISLFDQGFDSLSATFLRNRIIGTLRLSHDSTLQQAARSIPSNIVFEYPSVAQLTEALVGILDLSSDASAPIHRVSVDDIHNMVAKYKGNFSNIPNSDTSSSSPRVVLITGSTGSIGSHILASLLSESRVTRIYALVRGSDGSHCRQRLEAAFNERTLPTSLLQDGRLTYLAGDTTRAKFGVEASQYDELLNSVTHIIHTAWPVNFNLPLKAFEDDVAAVKTLVEICASSDRPIHLLVASSIGVASMWDPLNGPVPETTLSDPSAATSNGYSASKYVVEQIIEDASNHGVRATAVRIGQACGSKATGAWGTTEWFPIMVKSSVALGYFPILNGPVAWVPLDTIAQVFTEWTLSSTPLSPLINLVHPWPTSWDVVLRGIMQALGKTFPTIPMEDWVEKLEALSSNAQQQQLSNTPALMLLDTFKSMAGNTEGTRQFSTSYVSFETSNLVKTSSTAQEVQPISEEHAVMWVKYWKSVGYIA